MPTREHVCCMSVSCLAFNASSLLTACVRVLTGREVDCVATAKKNGWEPSSETPGEGDAVAWLMLHLQAGNTVQLIRANTFLLHQSRTREVVLLAQMDEPATVTLTEKAFLATVHEDKQNMHWLNSKIEWCGKERRIFRALKFIIQGAQYKYALCLWWHMQVPACMHACSRLCAFAGSTGCAATCCCMCWLTFLQTPCTHSAGAFTLPMRLAILIKMRVPVCLHVCWCACVRIVLAPSGQGPFTDPMYSPITDRYNRVGAPGTCFWIRVRPLQNEESQTCTSTEVQQRSQEKEHDAST